MTRTSTLAAWCERVIEGCWLLAILLIPTYFNLLSSRHFEPDKATTLRGLALIMIAVAVVHWLESLRTRSERRPVTTTDAADAPPSPGLLRRFAAFPLAIPTALYIGVFLLATITSVVPYTSFWGSYQRLQGTYSNLSYVAIGIVIVLFLRRREQLERLVTVVMFSALVAAGYGLVQHFQIDPLPWRGDVITRVASTMGNSIFVAAYLIMALPYVLYRVFASFVHASRAREVPSDPRMDIGWMGVYVLLILGALGLIYSAMQFGAVVRTSDLRYWYVYPGSLVVAGALFLVPTLRPQAMERIRFATLLPGLLAVGYALFVGISFSIGQSAGQQVQTPTDRVGADWPIWMAVSALIIVAAYGLMYVLPRRAGSDSRLFLQLQGGVAVLVALLILVAIVFTQSRGPWIGGVAGLAVFFGLLFWFAWSHARALHLRYAQALGALLLLLVIGVVGIGGFLVAFNLSNDPFFVQLRDVPYIGRMGRLLEVDEGTGLVRRLIWIGDDKAGGAVALIRSDPVRMVIGWGPESMFVAYNRFYPPALANIEARGASPDRSHQAYLDELINKGILGLVSYLFVLVAFFTLVLRLMRRTQDWSARIFYGAGASTIVAHAVEGFTGIPIVSTLMMQSVTIAAVVVLGGIDGHYRLPGTPQPAPVPVQPDTPAKPTASSGSGNRRRSGTVVRGAAQARTVVARPAQDNRPITMLTYAIIIGLTLLGVWAFNVDNTYADMRFQQGQSYTANPGASLEQQIVGMSFYLDAIRLEPQQDFYFLNLGRTMMAIIDVRRQTQGILPGDPEPHANVEALLRLTTPQLVQGFVVQKSPQAMMSYTEAVLMRAHDLNPMNKDHFANLARMYNFWYTRFGRDPKYLELATEWYRRGHESAPQDVVIMNEYASSLIQLAAVERERQNEPVATANLQRATELLERAQLLDPRYLDTRARLAELLRVQGRLSEAVDLYLVALQQNPRALDGQINAVLDSLRADQTQLQRLRDGYQAAAQKDPNDPVTQSILGLLGVRTSDLPLAVASFGRQVELQPTNIEARQNYTLVLSDSGQFTLAATQAQEWLTLAQQQQVPEQQRALIEGLLNYYRSQAGG